MDVKMKSVFLNMIELEANSPIYLKSLIFISKKEFAILKLAKLLPQIRSSSNNSNSLKITYMKIFPVLFSYAELNCVGIYECFKLIATIKEHPFFKQERSLFDGWYYRFGNLLWPRNFSATSSTENTFFNIPGSNMYQTIGYAELDLFSRYHAWLKYHKLHKYLFFFANLSYEEIQSIVDEDGIKNLEAKVDIIPMTEGGRKSILRKLEELRKRESRLAEFCKEKYYTGASKVEQSIHEIRIMFKTPIRKRPLLGENNLPDLLIRAMETMVFTVTNRLDRTDALQVFEPTISLLKTAWACSVFEADAKKRLNSLKYNLRSQFNKFPKKAKEIKIINNRIFVNKTPLAQPDIESAIKAMTFYLENVVLSEY